ncbi:DUF2510 domain-containing protein [Kitasatospora sp. NPDC094028]
MSDSMSPGWYPVLGADGTPGHERWWDGRAWTDDVRPLLADARPQTWQAQAPAPYPQAGYGYPPAPGYPGYPGQEAYPAPAYPGPGYPPPSPRRSRTGVLVGVAVGVLAVGGAVAAFVFLQGGDPKAGPTPGPTVVVSRSDSPSPNPTPKPAPSATGVAPDSQHAITVPLLDGWKTEAGHPGESLFLSTGSYTGPNGKPWVRGDFMVEKDTVKGATAKEAADTAMPRWAEAMYHGITEHTDYGSGETTVDGVPGYVTRWHVRSSSGVQGYVLVATFQAKGGGYVMFVGSVDDDAQAPDKDALEKILGGVKVDSGGSGSST